MSTLGEAAAEVIKALPVYEQSPVAVCLLTQAGNSPEREPIRVTVTRYIPCLAAFPRQGAYAGPLVESSAVEWGHCWIRLSARVPPTALRPFVGLRRSPKCSALGRFPRSFRIRSCSTASCPRRQSLPPSISRGIYLFRITQQEVLLLGRGRTVRIDPGFVCHVCGQGLVAEELSGGQAMCGACRLLGSDLEAVKSFVHQVVQLVAADDYRAAFALLDQIPALVPRLSQTPWLRKEVAKSRMYAAECQGSHSGVISACDSILAEGGLSPSDSILTLQYRADALASLGRLPQAIESYEAALRHASPETAKYVVGLLPNYAEAARAVGHHIPEPFHLLYSLLVEVYRCPNSVLLPPGAGLLDRLEHLSRRIVQSHQEYHQVWQRCRGLTHSQAETSNARVLWGEYMAREPLPYFRDKAQAELGYLT